MNRAETGKWMLISGSVLLTLLLAGSLLSAREFRRSACNGPAPTEASAADAPLVYSRDATLALNKPFCLAVNTKRYFAEQLTQMGERDAAVTVAEGLERDARKAYMNLIPPAQQASKEDRDKYNLERAKLAAALVDAEKKLDEARGRRDALAKGEASLALFVDGDPTPVTFPVPLVDSDGWYWTSPELRIPADAKPEDARRWRSMLGGLTHTGSRTVQLAVGDASASIPRTDAEIGQRTFRIFEPFLVYPGALSMLAMMAGLLMWQWDKQLLRDPPRRGEDGEIVVEDRLPFSLGRVQFAWWFILTLSGFLFIWLVTGQVTGVMTTGVVTLLGISAASAAVSVTIGAPPLAPEGQAAAGQAARRAASKPNFLYDILSDSTGLVLHRIQMFVWTVITGAIFVWSVVSTYAFPILDEAFLLLAGAVSAAYVGFKVPENKKP